MIKLSFVKLFDLCIAVKLKSNLLT